MSSDHGISGKHLVTFMSNSVAASMEKPSFWEGSDTAFPAAPSMLSSGNLRNLVTFMSNSASMEKPSFWEGSKS